MVFLLRLYSTCGSYLMLILCPVSFAGNNGSINSISDRGTQLPGHREVRFKICLSHFDESLFMFIVQLYHV